MLASMWVWWAAVVVAGVAANNTSVVSYPPEGKSLLNQFLISPLTVVRLLNTDCDADNGHTGTCVTAIECYKKGGVKKDLCGNGFGVCCLIMATENGVSYGNNTLILRNEFNAGVDITYTIKRMSTSICQYRLDVTRLDLYRPLSDGSCFYDYMMVNQDDKFGKICGLSQNLHYYIDVTSEAVFTFHTSASIAYTRDWEINVQQLTCDFMSTNAPQGCGQWYWGTTGTIDIWNNVDPNDGAWYYLTDQNYAICVRWEAGYCTITYTESLRFRPYCNDVFERPGTSAVLSICDTSPPIATTLTYTLSESLQYFYVGFYDNNNVHEGSVGNPFKNPSITYVQNSC